MQRKFYFLFLVLFFTIGTLYSAEKLTLASGDVYTCTFVSMNETTLVVLLYNNRLEVDKADVKQFTFESIEDELEIVLKDGTVLKGQIVEHDDEFFTIGTTAGLNTIEKEKITEIINPKYLYVNKKETIGFHLDIVPAYTTILNNFAASYNTFWSAELAFEMSFSKNIWFGLSADFIMLSPQFEGSEDSLFLIPAHLLIKYESAFLPDGKKTDIFTRLFWSLRFGVGVCTIMFSEADSGSTSFSFALSTLYEYGVRYQITELISFGIAGKTGIIIEASRYVLTQSGGVIIELKF